MRTIHSLEDLRKAKRELAKEKEASKLEFAQHLGALRQDATGYVVKKVVLPVGIGLALAFAAKYFFFGKDEKRPPGPGGDQAGADQQVKADVHKNTWLSYFSILLSIVKIYQSAIAQKQTKESVNEEEMPETDGDAGNTAGERMKEDEPGDGDIFSPKHFVQQYQQQKKKKS